MPPTPRGLRPLLRDALLPWFRANARPMPWRTERSPYRVWISEAMLQQTRVETVIPYFERWMRRFPDIRSLAGADLQDVLKAWEGLGYYARARNLHRAATLLVRDHQGALPSDPALLSSLPGIGPYTLAAILSLAFQKPHAVLDGNVERVLTRLLALPANVRHPTVKASLRDLANRLLGDLPPDDFNEAMMELGATVCLPRSPRCNLCPLAPACRAHRLGSPENFPSKPPAKKIPTLQVGAAVVWRDPHTFLIAQRKENGLLGGLWEFPGGKREDGESFADCVVRELREELGITVLPGPCLCEVRHTYSHFHLRMTVLHCQWQEDTPRAIDCADFRWVTRPDCDALPFSKADLKVLRALDDAAGTTFCLPDPPAQVQTGAAGSGAPQGRPPPHCRRS